MTPATDLVSPLLEPVTFSPESESDSRQSNAAAAVDGEADDDELLSASIPARSEAVLVGSLSPPDIRANTSRPTPATRTTSAPSPAAGITQSRRRLRTSDLPSRIQAGSSPCDSVAGATCSRSGGSGESLPARWAIQSSSPASGPDSSGAGAGSGSSSPEDQPTPRASIQSVPASAAPGSSVDSTGRKGDSSPLFFSDIASPPWRFDAEVVQRWAVTRRRCAGS